MNTSKTLLFSQKSWFSSLTLKSFFSPVFLFIYFNWRLITLQYCRGFCHTLTWISHGCTCVSCFLRATLFKSCTIFKIIVYPWKRWFLLDYSWRSSLLGEWVRAMIQTSRISQSFQCNCLCFSFLAINNAEVSFCFLKLLAAGWWSVWFLGQLCKFCCINIKLVSRKLRSVAHRLCSPCYKLNYVSSELPGVPIHCVLPALCLCVSVICSCHHPGFDPCYYWWHFLFVVWTFRCFLVSSNMDRVCIYVSLSYFGIFSKMMRRKIWRQHKCGASCNKQLSFLFLHDGLRNLKLIL